MSAIGSGGGLGRPDLGVTVEAEFLAGEYTVVILSAKEATGLEIWLKTNEYKIPEGHFRGPSLPTSVAA